MEMRPSRVLARLRAGQVASCHKINLDSARAVELAGIVGFDCVWLDTEHVATDWSVLERQIWAAKAHNVDVLVRVARGAYSDYVRPLELDAAGIMVPHCMGAEDARRVVQMTRFHPLGLRAWDGGNADGAYGNVGAVEYFAGANAQRFVALQIEDPEPLGQLDEIAALDGVDMLFFGPGDFSQAIGEPAQWDHPRVTEARRLVAEACARHGKIAGTVGSPANVQEYFNMGYRFVSMGADVLGLAAWYREILAGYAAIEVPGDSPASANGAVAPAPIRGIY
jgi:4-hydroxy-2-oxoheptanedioate aldolase